MVQVGFIGVGKMGRWMVDHLIDNGYHVTVYDKNHEATRSLKEKGAFVAPSVQDLGPENDVVITMLPDSNIVEAVTAGENGLFQSMNPGGTIIDMSSSYVFSTKRLAEHAVESGLNLIDAPVSGGVKGAKAGSLTIMVGGDEHHYQKVLPILECMGDNIHFVGDTGSGHALKAINNFLSATSLYATTEAMMMIKKLGIEPSVALEAINGSSGRSFSTEFKFPTFILPQAFNSHFSLELLLKDVEMAASIAKDTNVPTFLAAVVEQVYQSAHMTGDHGQDHTEIVKFLEKMVDESLVENK